jgi:hypothetical protein
MNHNEMPPSAAIENSLVEQLEQFQPTGEIEKDALEFFRITGREVVTEDRDSIIKKLTEIREALPGVLELRSSEQGRRDLRLQIDTIDNIIDMATLGRVLTSNERAELETSVKRLNEKNEGE